MLKVRGPNVFEARLVNRVALALELFHYLSHVEGVPQDDDVSDQIKTPNLMVELLIGLSLDFALVRVAEVRA